MSVRLKSTAVGVFVALSISTAVANDHLSARFERLDLDSSGNISWSEAYAVRAGEFVKLDKNLDGAVTQSEFSGRALPFSEFDADGDGLLQMSEYVSKHRLMFDKFDKDSSGSLDHQEFQAAQEAVGNR